MRIFPLLMVLLPFTLLWLSGDAYITFLRKRYLGQYIREDGPQSHLQKAGTPTTGGVLILLAMLFGSIWMILAAQGSAGFTVPVLLTLLVTLALGALGLVDDYLKIAKKQNKGVHGYTKLAVQVVLGLVLGSAVVWEEGRTTVSLFQTGYVLELGFFYPVLAAFLLTATSNAVNLTDGLDGLAASTAAWSFLAFSVLLFSFSEGNLVILSLSLLGSCLGFLLFNRYPARIFMGDSGSLALGGALASIAIFSGFELALLFFAALFLVETLSVILQVASFKLTGKRIFKMSPIHHHFELMGWHETKVVRVFNLFQFLACLVGLWIYSH